MATGIYNGYGLLTPVGNTHGRADGSDVLKPGLHSRYIYYFNFKNYNMSKGKCETPLAVKLFRLICVAICFAAYILVIKYNM